MLAGFGFFQTCFCDFYWVTGWIFMFRRHTRMRRKDRDTSAFTVDLKLFYRVRALQVSCHQDRSVAFMFEVLRQLPSKSRLTGTLQTDQHDNCRWRLRKVQLSSFATKDFFQLILNNLHDLLAGVQSFRNFFAECAFLDLGNKLPHGWYGNVGIEQRTTNFARCCIDIRLCKPAFTTKVFEG